MKTLFFFGLLLCFRWQPVFCQSLHVEGDALIRGRMELFNAPGDSSIFIGVKAGINDDGDNQNTFIGHRVGIANSSGKLNVYIGEEAGEKNINGSANAFIGFQSGHDNIDGDQNTFLGFKSGQRNTSGSSNVFVGYETGKNNSIGSSNTFLGTRAGLVNAGNGNVFIGMDAGTSNGSGVSNVFVGRDSGKDNETGFLNAFLGNRAGFSNLSGRDNTYLGATAGFHNSSGNDNTLIGSSAGSSNMGGSSNTYVGSLAGTISNTGQNNTYLGSQAGYQATGSSNVFLGFQAGFDETGSNKLYIDNSATPTPLIYGDFSLNRVGINRTTTTNTLEVQGTASKTTAGDWLANSDRRIKSDIKDIQNAREIITGLRPVTFRYSDEWRLRNPSIEDRVYYNFIAQEYREVFPHAVKGSGEFLAEDPEEILQIDSYDAQIVTIKAVQELILENQMLREEIRLLREIFTEFKSASSATNSQIKRNDQESIE